MLRLMYTIYLHFQFFSSIKKPHACHNPFCKSLWPRCGWWEMVVNNGLRLRGFLDQELHGLEIVIGQAERAAIHAVSFTSLLQVGGGVIRHLGVGEPQRTNHVWASVVVTASLVVLGCDSGGITRGLTPLHDADRHAVKEAHPLGQHPQIRLAQQVVKIVRRLHPRITKTRQNLLKGGHLALLS